MMKFKLTSGAFPFRDSVIVKEVVSIAFRLISQDRCDHTQSSKSSFDIFHVRVLVRAVDDEESDQIGSACDFKPHKTNQSSQRG